MKKIDVLTQLEKINDAHKRWSAARLEFLTASNHMMARLLHEAAANFMSAEEVAKASGFTIKNVRNQMRNAGLNPKDGKRLLSKKAAEALANNSALLGIEPREMDLMSPLAYLPMGEQMKRELRASAVSQVTEVSGNPNALEDRLYQAIVLQFEGMGEAWTTDSSGDTLARAAARSALSELGFCSCGASMPCLDCGRGL